MPTSGNNIYTLTTQQLIKDAFVKAGIYRNSATLPAEDYNYGLAEANKLIKGWQAMGFNIWNDKRATLFLQYNTAKYSFPTTHATESFVETTLSADATALDGTVDLTSVTGVTNGDYIGIVKDDGYIFWTTINGVPVGTVVTLTAAIDGDAAEDNVVFTYTTKITKPLSVKEVMLHQTDNNEVGLPRIERASYFGLSDKAAIGSPNQYYYERQRLTGDLYLWSTPSDVKQYVNFTYQPYLDNFVDVANEPDLPIEWERALVFGLASEFSSCGAYGVGAETYSKVASKAQHWLDVAKGNDNENGKLTFDMSEIW